MAESEWIKRYIAPLVTAEGADGLRDDVAILSTDGVIIANVDSLIEGVHFREDDPLGTVGRKLIRVNVSDILAKGAVPLEALLSIAWPRGWVEADFADLIAGIAHDLKEFDIALIGGDTVGTEGPLSLTLTLTGRCIGPHPVRRSGGSVGDQLWVSGEVGWGHIGLEAAISRGDPATIQAYRVPCIGSVETANIVAKHATASMDISDGLLIDALRLGEASNLGVRIKLDEVKLAEPRDAVEEILTQCTAGDDYLVLLATAAGTDVPGFIRIGELTESPGLSLTHHNININPPVTLGFEH